MEELVLICWIVSVCGPGVRPSALKISCWKASIGSGLKLWISFTKAPPIEILAVPPQLDLWQPIQLTELPVKVKVAFEPATGVVLHAPSFQTRFTLWRVQVPV